MIQWLQHRWTGLCLLVMTLGAVILFFFGFFPVKYRTGTDAVVNDVPVFIDGVSIDGPAVYNSGENAVVLMVIDGMRYDFATAEYMPFTGHLMKNQSACIHVTVADTPTVTMPRIKSPQRKTEKAQWKRTINFWRSIYAMMTGSVSTFADVALNFGAPAVTSDSVLKVADHRGRRAIMYGDDTWLRLFPHLWIETDGTSSFFVTDYTEVDNNVTRHLDRVLAPNKNGTLKFDLLILHYLGLDHIGHLEGARSPKVKPKLIEMDNVVKKIYTAMQKWNKPGYLIVVGDHGMRDAGGHGGSTPAEVLVPLILIKSRDFVCPYPPGPGPTVAQVDVAPSMAWLLNAPIPGDSTGRMLPALLPADMRQHLYLLHVIADHNIEMLGRPEDKEFYKQFMRAQKQFAQFLSTGQESAAKIAKYFYEECLDVMAKLLVEAPVQFDVFALGTALLLLYALSTAILCVTLYSIQPEQPKKVSTHSHKRSTLGSVIAFFVILSIIICILTISCFITETTSNVCSFEPMWTLVFIFVSISFTMCYFIIQTSVEKIRDLSPLKDLNAIDYLLIGGTLFHSWSFFGTSFIEEEHLTWYFFWNTLMFFILIRTIVVVVMYWNKRIRGATEVQDKPELQNRMSVGLGIVPKWVLLIALHRYLRTMNQTGDRWQYLPDTADWLNAPENHTYLQAHLVIGTALTLLICLYNVQYMNNVYFAHTLLTFGATYCIHKYRTIETEIDCKKDPPVKLCEVYDYKAMYVHIFWLILIVQFLFEILTYTGALKFLRINPPITVKIFAYAQPKAKTEDYHYESLDEPWNLNEVKLSLARSLTHMLLNSLMLTISLLMRPHNVIMVPSIYVTCKLTSQCMDHTMLDLKPGRRTDIVDTISRTLVHLWIGFLFFFYQGNSNSLASVDLGAGYVGLDNYVPSLVALRMGVHTYAGPALAGATLFCTLATQTDDWMQYRTSVWRATNIYALHRSYNVTIYFIIATIFRHHLYVWSVFSPKLLYDFVALVLSIQALTTIAEIIIITHVTSLLAKKIASRVRL